MTPSEERSAPAPPEESGLSATDNPELLSATLARVAQQDDPSSSGGLSIVADQAAVENTDGATETPVAAAKLLPRETGHDIGMGSPVPLSAELVGIITRLRNMKVSIHCIEYVRHPLTHPPLLSARPLLQDEDEDWSRWRDVVFRAKGALSPYGVNVPLPPQNRRKRGGPVQTPASQGDSAAGADRKGDSAVNADNDTVQLDEQPPQLTVEEALAKLESFRTPPPPPIVSPSTDDSVPLPTSLADSVLAPAEEAPAEADTASYCPECYLPLHPDPKPERLYIFLHALRYTTSLGSFETEMPEWAAEGWTWDKS